MELLLPLHGARLQIVNRDVTSSNWAVGQSVRRDVAVVESESCHVSIPYSPYKAPFRSRMRNTGQEARINLVGTCCHFGQNIPPAQFGWIRLQRSEAQNFSSSCR